MYKMPYQYVVCFFGKKGDSMKGLRLGKIVYLFYASEDLLQKFRFRVDLSEINENEEDSVKIIFENNNELVLSGDPIWEKNEPKFTEQGFYREVKEVGILYYSDLKKEIIVRYSEEYDKLVLVDSVMQFMSLSSLYFGYMPLHAAAIGNNDKGIIIMGNSGAGKTTMETSLLYNGFSYFSDDIVFIDSDLKMFSLNEKIVGLGENTVKMLNSCFNAQIDSSFNQEKMLWDVSKKRSSYDYLQPRLIFFPEIDAEYHIENILNVKKAELFVKIIELSISQKLPARFKQIYFCRLKHLVMICDGYIIRRNNYFYMIDFRKSIDRISTLIQEVQL